ncbi:xylulose 5-phosphate 3-epimerase [Ectothiorhodospiraceae bacterium 2226]|nr:xylulose 5-phosphate 3-epimerase [Ectothiorhodospiraceae bacterium 2226]
MQDQEQRFQSWAAGRGAVRHSDETQAWVKRTLERLAPGPGGADPMDLLIAADMLTNAAMWLVVHETYARRVYLDGRPLEPQDFKPDPQGHTGGSLNMVPAYVGYMLANALSGQTRGWIMGQGHTVSAIDSVNLLLDNMLDAHAERYRGEGGKLDEERLTRYVNDFYAYRLDACGNQDSPLGSHVNVNTAGGIIEGGYLGFAELQYVHMPLPGEQLIAFLSDGAWEEQRGSDWAPRWWRAEDSGSVIPIMINNGRRIDQRATLSQGEGLAAFQRHLELYSFEPVVFDGTDPAAFACMILDGEQRLAERAEAVRAGEAHYPVRMPYGVAVALKGAGFYGAGTNAAHGLPLETNPAEDERAARNFNDSARRLYVPAAQIEDAAARLRNHETTRRPPERDHPIANRDVRVDYVPELPYREVALPWRHPDYPDRQSPMDAIDQGFLAYVRANPRLRPRVGNPDEMRSNRMNATLDALNHRVTESEHGLAEELHGKVITALNEEAVICACLGNKGGINIAVTYEAFGPKMLGALRQEVIWADHMFARGQQPGWLSVPLVLTSNTFENGKNERSHQDPAMCEAMLGEPSDVSRVLFPADYNTAAASLAACYATHGRVFTLVVPKSAVPEYFDRAHAEQALAEGGLRLDWCSDAAPQVLLTAIGAFQFYEVLSAARRLSERGVACAVNYLVEPGRFRDPRGRREAECQAPDELRERLFPAAVPHRVFASHTRPEVMAGVLRPLDTGRRTVHLGFTNHGGTLNTAGMLFVNRLSWAHVVRAAARSLGADLKEVLEADELDALEGRRSPHGIII